MAKQLGFEKVVLKNHRLTGHFISKPESAYFQSAVFSAMLSYVQENPGRCSMKEARERLTLTFKDVKTVFDGLEMLKQLASFVTY